MRFCVEVAIQSRSHSAEMHKARGAGRKTRSHYVFHDILLKKELPKLFV